MSDPAKDGEGKDVASRSDGVWEIGFEGHESAQRGRMAALPLWVKIEWLEQAQQIVQHMQESRAKERTDDSRSEPQT